MVIGTAELEIVRQDLLRKFDSVQFWFYDISIGRGIPRVLPEEHPNSALNDDNWGTHFIFAHCAGPRL